jgi:hypothetical protein
MPTQNLVSATLPQGEREDILQKIAEIRAKLGFLVTLSPEEMHNLLKAGNGFAPFLDKIALVVEEHPEILPGTFDTEEFRRDYALFQALKSIGAQIDQLALALSDTRTALSSDLMIEGLEVYNAVKRSSDKVAGLGVVRDDLAVFFRRPRRTKVQETA